MVARRRSTSEGVERAFVTLLTTPTARALRSAAGNRGCHLVGGALRDLALGLQPRDLDVVVAGDGRLVARRCAATLGARFVDLGGERFAAYRVAGAHVTVDVWDRGRVPLKQDLRRRDFTIHSFALDLRGGELIDPFHGRADLDHRLLRATTATSFAKDPLRVLRLCRFATQLDGFRIAERTLALAARAADALRQVPAERTRSELELTLALPRAERAVELLVELRLYPDLWLGRPSDARLSSPRPARLARAFRDLETAAHRLAAPVDLYCARMALLFALLPGAVPGDPGVALTESRASGLLTGASARKIARLLGCERLPRHDSECRWFLHRMGELWATAVCLLAARSPEDPGRRGLEKAMEALKALVASSADEIFQPPPLVSGHDLQRVLGIEAGARLGQILAVVRRRQIEGRLASRDQALELARRLSCEPDPSADNKPG